MFGISIQKIIQLDHYKIKLLKLRGCCPILLNMQRHSREATVMPRRRGVAASSVINTASRSI